jgi:hypothetical protein
MFADKDPAAYNSTTGCLEDYNKLGMHHNLLLQEALEKLRGKHPNTTIVYADLFGPIMEMVESPRKFGKHMLSFLQGLNKMWFRVVIPQGLLCHYAGFEVISWKKLLSLFAKGSG